MNAKHLFIIASAIATAMIPVSCGDSLHDDIGSARQPEQPATTGDPYACHDFASEADNPTTRFTSPELSLTYTPGVIVERKAAAVAFTDITSGHRAVLDFSTSTGSLTIDGQPVQLIACRTQKHTDRHITIFAVTADNKPVVAVVDDL